MQDRHQSPAAVDTPTLESLRGTGPRLLERLRKLGVNSVADLLFHLPLRYQDRTRVWPLGSLRPGQYAQVEGEVRLTEQVFRGRRMLLSRIEDGSGLLTLRFFHFRRSQADALRRGRRLRCYGEVRAGAGGLEMVHPDYQFVDDGNTSTVADRLTPVYPATEGISQYRLRDLCSQALAALPRLDLEEYLPPATRARLGVMELTEALAEAHQPSPDADLAALEDGSHPAVRRLALDELVGHQLSLRQVRQQARRYRAPPLPAEGDRLQSRLREALGFNLTGAQQRVLDELLADMAGETPMMRLVQGDVGSGKTAVAALAAARAAGHGFQVALMAPTELLAEQHERTFGRWLAPLGVEVVRVGGRQRGSLRDALREAVAGGQAQLVIGTHALFEQDMQFRALGLVIIDEQHRFGVHQRLALREKGAADGALPHQLIMTATPIPRTLAMATCADLDISVIDELPPGRAPVTTVAVPDSRRADVTARVARACAGGAQAYWVCTLIEESEALQCEAAENTAAMLAEALPAVRSGLVHGRMKATDKAAVMQAFEAGDIDLLVATTVIEVGVDVPNASLMVIENAERLGLAQLHQLRGRIGRGHLGGHCVLMYHPPLVGHARERLAVMRETADGFEIARRDLELRGPGEVLGTRQTGEQRLRIADLVRDQQMLPHARQLADDLLARQPALVARISQRWLGADTDRYVQA